MEIVPIRTSGDRGNREVLGSFVKEIQESLLAGEVDVALHCLKDLPTRPIDGLVFAANLKREDPTDALICRDSNWKELPHGAIVGTGSVRRTSQLAAHRPDLKFKPLVGNIDTRMRKLQEGVYDAIVLATAGLQRFGVLDNWAESEYSALSIEALDILPAAGQAILILEVRTDSKVRGLIESLNDVETECSGIAERAFLSSFGSGCSMPVAAHAIVKGESLVLNGLVASVDGRKVVRGTLQGPIGAPRQLGEGLARKLCEQGARDLIPEANV